MSNSNLETSSSPEPTHNRASPTTHDTGGTKAPATEQVKTVMGPRMGMPAYLDGTSETLVGFNGMPGGSDLQTWPSLSLENWTFEGAQMSMTGGSGVAPNSVNQFEPFPIANAGVQVQEWGMLAELMNPVFGGGNADLPNVNGETANATNTEIPDVDAYKGVGGVNGGMANGYGMRPMNSMYPSISQSFELPTQLTVSNNQTSTSYEVPPIDDLNSNAEISLGTRVRRPATSKEVVPLTGMKETPGDLPTWMALALEYLNDEIAVEAWSECLEAWTTFERENGLSEVSSVSSVRDVHT